MSVGRMLPTRKPDRMSRTCGGQGLSAHRREGDDTTPIGLFGFQSTMYGVLPNPGCTTSPPSRSAATGDERSSSALYNHFVHVPCGTKPNFGGGSEALWQTVPSYDYFAVIAYNRHPIVPGRGSAIFLHVSTGHPTAGCVSIPPTDLVKVLRDLRPSSCTRSLTSRRDNCWHRDQCVRLISTTTPKLEDSAPW